jgi:5S rRNA maturation endonuclease (ribonuclease M5)
VSGGIFELLRDALRIEDVAARVAAIQGEKARCVSGRHEDRNPSMHLYGDHAHCFACGYHADVTCLWADGRGIANQAEAARDLAREFGVELPERDPEAEQKSRDRRALEERYLEQSLKFHRNLARHPNVRERWERRGFKGEDQERFLLGANEDGTEATIPYRNRGRVQGIIRRKLEGEPKYVYPKVEEFPAGHKPLFIPGSLRGDVYLVEGILDALALAALGESAVAVGGAYMSREQMEELRRLTKNKPVYLLPDADEDGEKAARRWAQDLYPAALLCPAEYGEKLKDFADLYQEQREGAREVLEELKGRAVDALDIATVEIPNDPSKRRRLAYVRESALPLILQQLETRGPIALLEPAKDSEVMAILDDVAAAAKLKAGVIKAALEEAASQRLEEFMDLPQDGAGTATQDNRPAPEEYEHLLEPGVLDRYVAQAAKLHGAVGDEETMRLVSLVAFGAQLDLLPNGKPLGPSVMLIAEAGRGKNYLTDAVVGLLPENWYLAFESASAVSLYYQCEREPDFLKHRFIYPNEAEATDMLVEFLRPMLSAGKAVRLTVNKNDAGRNTGQELEVRGPVTTIIPTVRNKLDEQLMTRLLVAELDDYEGRVKQHARAFSKLLLPDYAPAGEAGKVGRWQVALESLTGARRVVVPVDREEFALNDDAISHGARLWANVLGLMAAHAWLEQRNREIAELPSGTKAIVAAPEDYEAAYRVFAATSRRTVINISETHRKILDALHRLQQADANAEGFPQRRIAKEAGIKQSTVSKNKTFLVTSAKLVRETEYGLALVADAEPSWWAGDDLMHGFPTPEMVRRWWTKAGLPDEAQDGNRSDDREPGNSRNTGNRGNHSAGKEARIADTCAENGHRTAAAEPGIGRNRSGNHDPDGIPGGGIAENGLARAKTGGEGRAIPGIPMITDSAGNGTGSLTAKEVGEEMRRSRSGPALALRHYLDRPSPERLKYLATAVLVARGEDTSGWERCAAVAEKAASDPANHPIDCDCEACL